MLPPVALVVYRARVFRSPVISCPAVLVEREQR
jgi:hypothetical protein